MGCRQLQRSPYMGSPLTELARLTSSSRMSECSDRRRQQQVRPGLHPGHRGGQQGRDEPDEGLRQEPGRPRLRAVSRRPPTRGPRGAAQPRGPGSGAGRVRGERSRARSHGPGSAAGRRPVDQRQPPAPVLPVPVGSGGQGPGEVDLRAVAEGARPAVCWGCAGLAGASTGRPRRRDARCHPPGAEAGPQASRTGHGLLRPRVVAVRGRQLLRYLGLAGCGAQDTGLRSVGVRAAASPASCRPGLCGCCLRGSAVRSPRPTAREHGGGAWVWCPGTRVVLGTYNVEAVSGQLRMVADFGDRTLTIG